MVNRGCPGCCSSNQVDLHAQSQPGDCSTEMSRNKAKPEPQPTGEEPQPARQEGRAISADYDIDYTTAHARELQQ